MTEDFSSTSCDGTLDVQYMSQLCLSSHAKMIHQLGYLFILHALIWHSSPYVC